VRFYGDTDDVVSPLSRHRIPLVPLPAALTGADCCAICCCAIWLCPPPSTRGGLPAPGVTAGWR
jgi:hypothetical protein